MKTIKLYSICLFTIITTNYSQMASAQLANFYSSPNYSNFINNMISNSIWQSSMDKYTKQNRGSSVVFRSDSSRQSLPIEVPEYRKYPAVQFKSTGTRLTLQEYLDAVENSPEEKAELKELILKIFSKYEAEAAAKGYSNDWALAYVSYVGLNSLVYHGTTDPPIIPFEQNLGLRDVVAEYAVDNGLFNGVPDQQKQELYELMVMIGGLTYHYFEKANREKNAEEIKNCRLAAAQNLKLIGVSP